MFGMKKKLVFAAGIVSALFTFAAAETLTDADTTMRLKASRDGSIYKKGEPVEFVLEVKKGETPRAGIRFWSSVSKDGVNPTVLNTGITDKNGRAVVRGGSLGESGVLRCQVGVYNPDTKKETQLMAGAGFELEKIRQGVPMPSDFKAYWEAQKKILAAIPLNAKMEKIDSEKAGVELFDIKADSFRGKLSGYYARPEGAAAKSCPAIIFPHGAGVGSSNKWSPRNWATKGFIALDYNAHGILNGQPAEYYKNLNENELKGYRYRGSDSLENCFFRELYLRTQRALDFLMAQPEWDGKILVAYGTSQGGGQALGAGGLCDKVSMVVACVPAMCDHNAIAVKRTNGWPNFMRGDKYGAYDMKVFKTVPYFDAANFASLIKGEVLITAGLRDNVCPPSSVFAAYNNVKTKKRYMIAEEGSHTVPRDFYDKCSQSIMAHVKEMREVQK